MHPRKQQTNSSKIFKGLCKYFLNHASITSICQVSGMSTKHFFRHGASGASLLIVMSFPLIALNFINAQKAHPQRHHRRLKNSTFLIRCHPEPVGRPAVQCFNPSPQKGGNQLKMVIKTPGWLGYSTWRIIPVSKQLVIPMYKQFRPFVRGITPVRGLTNHVY